jgi:glutamate racemase
MMKNLSEQAIGVFDSGVGGTSIWKEIRQLLPNENTIYLADSKNAPYGIKSKSEIIALCEKNTELLLEKECKLIVVACNTATTNAISHLRNKYSVPFIGIEPAIKPASLKTNNKAVGILATKGTLTGELFLETASIYSKRIKLIEQHGTGIVELIEAGKTNTLEMERILEKYLEPMINANIDYLVLGCSHYPYLIPILKKILPSHVNIIDSGNAVANQTRAILTQKRILNPNNKSTTPIFYTNREIEILSAILDSKYSITYLDF